MADENNQDENRIRPTNDLTASGGEFAIVGATRLNGTMYRAGDEAKLNEAIDALPEHQKDAVRAHLAQSGAVTGMQVPESMRGENGLPRNLQDDPTLAASRRGSVPNDGTVIPAAGTVVLDGVIATADRVRDARTAPRAGRTAADSTTTAARAEQRTDGARTRSGSPASTTAPVAPVAGAPAPGTTGGAAGGGTTGGAR